MTTRRPAAIRIALKTSASIERVWDALTHSKSIAAWMQDDSAHMSSRRGTTFKLFGGETTGKILLAEKPSILHYTWRMAGWDASWPDSVVHWNLSPLAKGGTKITLVHLKLPTEEERKGHNTGWHEYWLDPMKEWLESK